MIKRSRTWLCALTLLVVLAGCSDGTQVTDRDSSSDSGAEAPLELKTYTGENFSILLPATWTVLTPADLDLGRLLEDTDVSNELGISTEQIAQVFEQGGKLFAFDFLGAHPTFVSNILILELPLFPGLTTEGLESISLQDVEMIGAEVHYTEIRSAPIGEVVIIRYDLAIQGVTSEAISMRVLADGAQWAMTLTALDVDPHTDMFDRMIESLVETS